MLKLEQTVNPKKMTSIFIVLFLILTIISVPVLLITHQEDYEKTEVTTLANYVTKADFDYKAYLLSNEVYQNQTILKPEEGNIYESIVDHIVPFLYFSFNIDIPSTISITYSLDQKLETDSWKIELVTTEPQSTSEKQIEVNLPSFKKEEIETKKKEIEDEIGSYSSDYSVVYSTSFNIVAKTEFGSIQETFSPQLNITLTNTPDGKIFAIENLNQEHQGQLSKESIVWDSDIMAHQFLSFILAIFSASGLAISSLRFIKQPHETEPKYLITQKKWKKLVKSYPNLFFEAKKSKTLSNKKYSTVNLKSLEELIRLAETADKPIMYSGNLLEREFFLIDQDCKYVFTNYPT